MKRKVIDCILVILERMGDREEKSKEELLQIFAADPYNKIVRKLGSKQNYSIGSLSD